MEQNTDDRHEKNLPLGRFSTLSCDFYSNTLLSLTSQQSITPREYYEETKKEVNCVARSRVLDHFSPTDSLATNQFLIIARNTSFVKPWFPRECASRNPPCPTAASHVTPGQQPNVVETALSLSPFMPG